MTTLSGSLTPFERDKILNQYYVKFTNSENCTVYVPITTTDPKKLDACLGKSVISQLDNNLKAICRNTSIVLLRCSYLSLVPELYPLLKPDSEMILNGNSRKLSTHKLVRRSNRIVRPTERMQLTSQSRRAPSINFEATDEPFDLHSLERLCRVFTNRRAELNLVQSEVSRSFARLYGVHRSASLISRFERMKLSLSNFLKVCPVLYQWVKDTETEEGRKLVIQAAREKSPVETPISSNSAEVQNLSSMFVKRRQRRNLTPEVKQALAEAYWKNPNLGSYELRYLADTLNVDASRIRQWFYNRRCMDRNKDDTK